MKQSNGQILVDALITAATACVRANKLGDAVKIQRAEEAHFKGRQAIIDAIDHPTKKKPK